MSSKTVAWLILVVIVAIIARSLFPKTVEKQLPPIVRIQTQYDTVQTVDTLWKDKLRVVHDMVNLVERVVVSVPETVRVLPRTVGVTAVSVPPKFGDSALVTGFDITPTDSVYLKRMWTAQYFTTGPLRSLIMDSVPPKVEFFPPPKVVKGCGFFCSVTKYLEGGVGGFAVCKVIP